MDNKYFKTGDIAKFSNVSSDTVRYYDKENVVAPSIVKDNRYRYYTLGDALKFDIATLLRELDVPLQELRIYLAAQNVEDTLLFHEKHIKVLQQQQLLLEKKISYLQEFDKRIRSFEMFPNKLEYIENEEIYICSLLSFLADEQGFHLDKPIQEDCVDDVFWSRTSIIGFINTIENINAPEMGRACCFNIIPDDCNEVEKIQFERVLRFNYVGNPFSDSNYLEKIFRKVSSYCELHKLTPSKTFYQLYYLSQNTNINPIYYIHIFFAVN